MNSIQKKELISLPNDSEEDGTLIPQKQQIPDVSAAEYNPVNNLTIHPDRNNIAVSPKIHNKWWSIRIIYFTMFLFAISFSMVITNVFPYLRTLNRDVDKGFYGWVISAFSIGQFFSAPLFGWWFNHRPAREVFVLALITSMLSNILYAYGHVFSPQVAIYIILLTRLIIGFAFGSASVMRAYIASATTESERTSALANLNATRSVGFFIGPVIGFAFQPISYPGYTIPYINLRFNMYTCPAYFCSIFTFINLISFIWFKEFSVFKKKKSYKRKVTEETPLINQKSESDTSGKPPFDKIAIIVCILQILFFSAVWCSFETLTTPYSMDEFAWTNQQAIFYNNIVFAISGILSLGIIIAVKYLVKYFQERSLHVTALIFLAIAIYICIPWPGELPYVKSEVLRVNNSLVSNTTEVVGCDYERQAWCLYVPKLREFQFWLSPILFSIAFPMSGILLMTIFSKILGPHPPGLYMGVFTSAGALARIVGPASFSHLYMYTGPQVTFATIVGVVVLSVLLYLIFYHRMVPYTHRYPAYKPN